MSAPSWMLGGVCLKIAKIRRALAGLTESARVDNDGGYCRGRLSRSRHDYDLDIFSNVVTAASLSTPALSSPAIYATPLAVLAAPSPYFARARRLSLSSSLAGFFRC